MWQRVKNVYHLGRSVLANIYYGSPAKDMTVIGVTGTDGKTTTSHLIYHILTKARKKAALISTVAAVIDGKTYDTGFHVSTPDAFGLQPYYKKAKNSGTEYIVQEVTSHALDQNRVYGVPFAIGVLTNITQEHLDYHITFDRYVAAKAKLLQSAKKAVINRDDASYKRVLPLLQDRSVITYGMKMSADINPLSFPFKTKLVGDYNKYNCLAAIAVCQALGVGDQVIRSAIADFKLPKGRLEVVYDGPFRVIIDFAHTPNSIEQVLKTVKSEGKKDGKLIHVFGAAGERDRGKRPVMGKMSSRYSDFIILTSEDPRSESVATICDDITQGILSRKGLSVIRIQDRREAIKHAITIARSGDTVIITGKGHERSMNFGNGEEPWSDHDAVKKALQYMLHGKK